MADEYIHGRDPGETARLERQAAFIGNVLLDRVEVPAETDAVLDLGCGVGAMTRRLMERGAAHPVGVDHVLTQAKEARRLTPRGGASFLVADGRNLPFADESFELVYTSWFFEHVPDVPAVLAEVWRVLQLGGSLWACEVENSSLLMWPESQPLIRSWEALNRVQLAMHGDPFIGRKMFSHLKTAGFVVDVWPHTFHCHGGRPDALEAVVQEFVEILRSARENVLARGLVDAATYDRGTGDLVALPRTPGGTFTFTFLRSCATKERRGQPRK